MFVAHLVVLVPQAEDAGLLSSSPVAMSRREEFFGLRRFLPFAQRLLARVAADWLPLFSLKERDESFDIFFSSTFEEGAVSTLLSLGAALNVEIDAFVSKQVVRLVSAWFDSQGVESLLSQAAAREVALETVEEAAQVLVSLPDRIANRLQGKVPSSFVPRVYFPVLCGSIADFLKSHVVGQKCGEKATLSVSVVLARICTAGHATAVAEMLSKFLNSRSNKPTVDSKSERKSDAIARKADRLRQYVEHVLSRSKDDCGLAVTRSLMGSMHSGGLEKLLVALFESNQGSEGAVTIASYAALDNEIAQKLICTSLPVGRTFIGGHARQQLLAAIIGYDILFREKMQGAGIRPIVTVVLVLARVWGDKEFVNHGPYAQQDQITELLQGALMQVQNREEMERQKIVGPVVEAIQIRLNNPVAKIRQDCMNTAELFASKLDPQNPLRFDSDDESDHHETKPNSEGSETSMPASSAASTSPATIGSRPRSKRSGRKKGSDDPDRVMLDGDSEDSEGSASNEESDDAETSESDDDLVPYAIDDDGAKALPLKEVPEKQIGGTERIGEGRIGLPNTMKQCLGYLRTQNADEIEAVLFALPQLLQRTTDMAGEEYAEIAFTLLKLQETIAMDNFEARRRNSLVALTCKDPVSVCVCLCKALWNSNESLAAKLEAVEVLRISAFQLSSFEEVSELPSQDMNPIKEVGQARRWSKKLGIKQRIAKPNEFGKFVDCFFFAVVSGWHSEGAARVIGPDFLLGGRILCTLGCFVECGGNSPSTRVIAKSLVELISVSAIRLHPQVFVRRCTQFALMKVLFTLPESIFLSDYKDELSTLLGWVQEISHGDSDPEVAEMALINCQTLSMRASSTLPKIAVLDW